MEFELGTGIFQSPTEVVIAGLRRLKAEHGGALPQLPETREELATMLLESAASLDAAEGVNAAEAFDQLRERSRAMRSNG